MLFSNYRINIRPRETPEGSFNGAIMGEFEAGSRRFYLSVSRKSGKFIMGNRSDLALIHGGSRPDAHVWRIDKRKRESTPYLILSSRRTDRCLGAYQSRILAPESQTIQLVDYATSPRYSTAPVWQVVFLEAAPGDIFAVSNISLTRGVKTHRLRFYIVDTFQVKMVEPENDSVLGAYQKTIAAMRKAQRHYTEQDVKAPWANVLTPITPPIHLF